MRLRLLSVLSLLGLLSCHRRPRASQPAPAAVTEAVVEARPTEDAPAPSGDLLPGSLVAFGLPLPTVTQERFSSEGMKVFRVDAAMPRVMRYLEQRLEMHDADIHPLAAVIRRAIVRGAPTSLVVDVGVRDEGDRTMVTVWNRTPTPAPTSAPGTLNEGLRSVGIDPATGQYAPEFNR